MDYLSIFREVLQGEAKALEEAAKKINQETLEKVILVFEKLTSAGGNLFFCGVGKSGIVASKLSSTFSSMGLPSFFLHPTEALHGDLGRLTKNDAIVMVSKSGTTEELLKLFPFLPMDQSRVIGLLGQNPSPLAEKCTVVLDCSVEKEACLINQAPTASTTVTMGVGDGLAVLYQHMVGLSHEGFAGVHPGGFLGKSLRLKVRDLMIPAKNCPTLGNEATLADVILKMTEMPLGIAVIVENGRVLGIIVEGDIRRTLSTQHEAGLKMPVSQIMNKNPVFISPEGRAYEALELMEKRLAQISVLPVMEGGSFLGIIRLHDLLREGFLPKK